MQQNTQIKYLKDYQQPNYLVEELALTFEILANKVLVTNTAKYIRNNNTHSSDLILNGSSELVSISLNKSELKNYTLNNDELTLKDLPEEFTLNIQTNVNPFDNKSCMGLYASNGNLFTQNEPEGFRKITYYQDRSDVMTKFTTTIIANADDYPVMLSNGNKISERILSDGRTEVVWIDPFKKPSYLFALVAGKFSVIQDKFITKSNREVLLEVYSEADSIAQCGHCMESVKKAMKWDETRFNLEYDLDRYMIVASGDFNMGAMENKGLNIFNTKYVLAESKTATDTDFINVEAVVGHEYFHNWTGNRITCRDWFQLSLKEGLTVFRDQEFTADMHSRDVKRIQDVKALRQNQFPEDASPLAHPVRPASYLEINNFYTMTIYEKGSEVVRMYQTILGTTGFNNGMELYISRHDGEAATCENFCNAMFDANHLPFVEQLLQEFKNQFMLWYSQAGTPVLDITDNYDHNTQVYSLSIDQHIPDTPDMKNKSAMLIPVAFGLLDKNGNNVNFDIINDDNSIANKIIKHDGNYVLLLDKFTNTFKFKVALREFYDNTEHKLAPSLLRGFSAPVVINYPYTNDQLLNIAAHDSDSFNRWEAMQNLFKHEIMCAYNNDNHEVSDAIINALTKSLNDTSLDDSMKSLLANMPNAAELCAQFKPINIHQLVNAIDKIKYTLANKLETIWLKLFEQSQTENYNFNDSGKRSLKNTAIGYLCAGQNANLYHDIICVQYNNADNMTDKIGALSAINNNYTELRQQILNDFCTEYQAYPLVMDKWFMLQTQSQRNDTLEHVKSLSKHPAFDNQNPNKLYALVRAFTTNSKLFHTIDGYNWIADEVLRIDKFNPSVAGRIAGSFSSVNSLTQNYKDLAKPILERILNEDKLSKDVYELVSKILV